MKKFRYTVVIICVLCCLPVALLIGCSAKLPEFLNNVKVINITKSPDSSIMITVTNEIQVEDVLECFNGVHFDVNDDFSIPDNIENAMLISTKNGEGVEGTMFIYPNGAVEANYNNVAYSAADGSVDYELLYEIVKEIENS